VLLLSALDGQGDKAAARACGLSPLLVAASLHHRAIVEALR
jgi:hypothetical protein